jgi:hypothetical protein
MQHGAAARNGWSLRSFASLRMTKGSMELPQLGVKRSAFGGLVRFVLLFNRFSPADFWLFLCATL